MGDKKKSDLTLEDFLIAFLIAFSIVFVIFLTVVVIGYKTMTPQTVVERSTDPSLAAEPTQNVTEPSAEPSSEPEPEPTASNDFIEKVTEAIDGQVGEGESVLDIEMDGNNLILSVDLSNTKVHDWFPMDALAETRYTSITDAILELDKYDELWDTITVDFGELGYITCGKDDIGTNEWGGRYFDSSHIKLISGNDAVSDTPTPTPATTPSPTPTPSSTSIQESNNAQSFTDEPAQNATQPPVLPSLSPSVEPEVSLKPTSEPSAQSTAGTVSNGDGTYTRDFSGGRVLATTQSNNGGDPVYHIRNCQSAKTIPPENEYWYESAQAAENAGRRLCGNC